MPMTELLSFPCEFPIKAMGYKQDQFKQEVLTVIRQYYPELKADAVRTKPSKDGTYLSITVTIEATSQQQLDDIYRALSASQQVIMAL